MLMHRGLPADLLRAYLWTIEGFWHFIFLLILFESLLRLLIFLVVLDSLRWSFSYLLNFLLNAHPNLITLRMRFCIMNFLNFHSGLLGPDRATLGQTRAPCAKSLVAITLLSVLNARVLGFRGSFSLSDCVDSPCAACGHVCHCLRARIFGKVITRACPFLTSEHLLRLGRFDSARCLARHKWLLWHLRVGIFLKFHCCCLAIFLRSF